jgi:hypothetical protein
VYAEDKQIIETVQAGKGAHQPIGLGKEWTIQSARVAGDQGQKNAVYHMLRSCDLLTGIAGKPGVGKTSTISEAATPVSATSQINAVQMLVSLSRASREVRLYTDSKAVLREAAIRPGQGASAIELIDGESKPEVDLWQIGHNAITTQKEVEIIRVVQRSSQITKREQVCETIRKSANREMRMERYIER